jgi:DNA-binding transcriptional LysR family regulator
LTVTRPLFHQTVATLERQLGTTLVDRGIRPLRLTQAGSALAQRAAAAFEQIAAAKLEVEAIANLSVWSLRVGTFSSAGAAMLVDALRALRSGHPDVDVSITEIGMPSAVTRSLRRGDLDVAVSFDYPEMDTFDDDLALVHLLDDPFDVVVPRGHRFERKATIRFADLGGESDVRSGSVKRCATAFGEGAMVVRFVHERFSDGSSRPLHDRAKAATT